MKNVGFTIVITIIFLFSFSMKDEKEISIRNIEKIDSLRVSFSIANNGKDAIIVYSLKQSEIKDCERLLCSPRWHFKKIDGWGIKTEWWGSNNYDSIIIRPKKSHCFFVEFNIRKQDTLLAVGTFKTINPTSKLKKSFYLCFSEKSNLISEFRPDFENLQMLSAMDPTKLYKEDY